MKTHGQEQMIPITSDDRWQVYFRLKALGVTCCCQSHQALEVQVQSPLDVIQIWAVVQAVDAPRGDRVARLERSWRLPAGIQS